ncbi:MAG: hypothetical protein HY294_04620 [Candidatus Rokubacteria bacterium]|nr:hypothetical protein [Candidatus Rokubacteria bacterium]
MAAGVTTGARKTVLLLSRGMRLHRFFREMAADLATDHRVVVVGAPEERASFSTIPGVIVRPHASRDIPGVVDGVDGNDPGVQEEARRIEREIGLPVHRAASNYLLYGRIVRGFGGRWRYLDTEAEIVAAYVAAHRHLSRIFDEFAPTAVFYETVDLVSCYVALALACRRGIFALDFRFSPLSDGQISISFGVQKRNVVLEYLYAHPEAIEPASWGRADELVGGAREHMTESAYATVHRRMVAGGRRMLAARLRAVASDWRRGVAALRNTRWHYRAARNRAWLERHLAKSLPAPPYIAFWLQHLPEASTCAQAPRWIYQDAIVEQLAVHAPAGLTIVVKEHPRTYGRRGREFFAPLLALPNVVACHPLVDNHALLSRAEAIVAVTGSVGLDGILLGKRVGVLGRPFYTVYRGLRCLDAPEEIFGALADESWRPEQMVDERRRFLAAYVQSWHDFGHGEGGAVLPRRGGDRWAAALRRTLSFIERHGLKPADFPSGL